MAVAGNVIRVVNFALRLAQLCASVIILGIFSYFLAVLADHELPADAWLKAVAGISGGATFYSLLASVLTLGIGSVRFVSGLAMILDSVFIAGFVAIAIMSRHGTESCTGIVNTPLGNGEAQDPATGYGPGGFGTGDGKNLTFMPTLRSACTLQKCVFAVSMIGMWVILPNLRRYSSQLTLIKLPLFSFDVRPGSLPPLLPAHSTVRCGS